MIKALRKIGVWVIALALVFLITGVVYVLLTDRNPKKSQQPINSSPQPAAFPKPHQPNPNAPEGVAVETLLSPVSPGQNTTLTVDTNPTSTCNIEVKYNNVPAKDSGLAPKTADAFGRVSWTWTVASDAAVGKWPIKVTCTYHSRSGVVQGDLEVAR